ncbi:MAG: FAD-dependent oxidoreductase [Bacteroidetes bacterium]|jgi:glycine/D-amino acid oxidase-like deaminating enzyme|nr:FAD-dependent oxidoreductase [Bacteroidota bacterium]
MYLSFWENTTYFKNVDIAIIGSGIVGLNAALSLKKKDPKLKIIVLERGMFPSGASSKNAGFACFGSTSELLDDLTKYPENEVLNTVEKRWKGLERLRKNLGDKAIDFHNWGGYEIFDSEKEFIRCNEQLSYLNKSLSGIIGKKTIYKRADEKISAFGFKNLKHIIVNTSEGQIDTGKMMNALIAKVRSTGVEIINGFEVKDMKDDGKNVHITSSNDLNFSCKKVIVATNGFAKKLLPDEPVVPARAQVLITSPVKNLKLKGTFHYDSGYYYFRNIGDRVLLGGGRNLDFKTEETSEFGLTQLVQNRLEELLQEVILPKQKYEIEMRWSGIMGVGPAKKSIVKPISKNVFCAVRMGGMGVAIGSLVGEEVAVMVGKTL